MAVDITALVPCPNLRKRFRWLLWLTLIAASFYSPLSAAHSRSVSYSFWSFETDSDASSTTDQGEKSPKLVANIRVRLPLLALTRLQLHPDLSPNFLADVSQYSQRSLQLRYRDASGGTASCVVASTAPARTSNGWVEVRWQAHCPAAVRQGSAITIHSELFAQVSASHLHFARLQQPLADTRILTVKQPSWNFSPFAPAQQLEQRPKFSVWKALKTYTAEGVTHILGGWDHLAFVLGLLLLVTRWRDLLLSITGFTLGHSLTLVLATYGWIRINVLAIEAIIALTIAIVALEYFWRRSGWRRPIPIAVIATLLLLTLFAPGNIPRVGLFGLSLFTISYWAISFRSRQEAQSVWWLAAGFGLLHGLAFANVLSELELPSSQLASALFGFNIGVELGQCLLVAIAWPALQWLRRWSPAKATLVGLLIAAGLLASAVQWFISRNY